MPKISTGSDTCTPTSMAEGHFWVDTPVVYALQLDVLLLLKRLSEHFVSSCFAIQTSREFDAVKIVVGAVIVTIADVFLRKRATDIPSELSLVLQVQFLFVVCLVRLTYDHIIIIFRFFSFCFFS